MGRKFPQQISHANPHSLFMKCECTHPTPQKIFMFFMFYTAKSKYAKKNPTANIRVNPCHPWLKIQHPKSSTRSTRSTRLTSTPQNLMPIPREASEGVSRSLLLGSALNPNTPSIRFHPCHPWLKFYTFSTVNPPTTPTPTFHKMWIALHGKFYTQTSLNLM